MRIKNKTRAVCSLCAVRFLNKRIPLAVRWQITNRCVLQCRYCAIWKEEAKEPPLEEIVSVLDQLAALGTQTISFSGGEPMLRKDIFAILSEAKKRNISTEMNSTGAFIPQAAPRLKDLDFLKISLDGPQEINDVVRGKGSFQMALEAAEAAARSGLRFIFTATMTKYNIGYLESLVDLARGYKTMVAFQPVKSLYRGLKDISDLAPGQQEYRRAVEKLILLKKQESSCLRNSLIGLRHIYRWPSYPALKCWAGRVFIIIEADGTVFPCDRIAYRQALPNFKKLSMRECLKRLPVVSCSGCGFCGVLELNFLLSLKPGVTEVFAKVLK